MEAFCESIRDGVFGPLPGTKVTIHGGSRPDAR